MTEIEKTLKILKARWPEVVLIIGIHVISVFLNKSMSIIQSRTTSLQAFIDIGFLMALVVIAELLTIGFQRTLYLEGQKRQTPLFLLQTSKPFLGRIVKFSLFYMPICWILARLIFLVIEQFLPIDTGLGETAKSIPHIHQLCFTLASIITMKLCLFILPLIIVLDCRIKDSFKLLKKCKLSEAKELVVVFFILQAVAFLWVFMPSITSAAPFYYYTLIVSQTVIQAFIGLILVVMSVRFVASLDLVYDNQSESSDYEDLGQWQ